MNNTRMPSQKKDSNLTMEKNKIDDLLQIMLALRDPKAGCPWDKKQTFDSIVKHTLEEAYEVADAISKKDYEELKGELGDLLFQVVFYAQLANEQNLFDFSEVVDVLNEKLIRRHPHVFSNATLETDEQINENWEKEKQKERALKAGNEVQLNSTLDNIPLALPALNRAYKIQKRCAAVGFDWAELEPVVDKIKEELDEVLFEVNRTDITETEKQALIEEELGDLLFANVNLVRHLKADPEQVLRQANSKFEKRFKSVESIATKKRKLLEACSLEELDAMWEQVKKSEKSV